MIRLEYELSLTRRFHSLTSESCCLDAHEALSSKVVAEYDLLGLKVCPCF
jgi:hypothetical protein